MKRILRYFRARRFERDLADEFQTHLDELADDLAAGGHAPDDARAGALRGFGNRTGLMEACREKWAYPWLDDLVRDLRFALRLLRKSPVFTTVAVLSLAFGIGSNTVIFSAVDNVLLHALPYPDAGRLFVLWSRLASHGAEPMHVSSADFYDWRTQSRTFQSLSAYASWPMNLTGIDEPRRIQTLLVSANLFATLGVPAQLGRTFALDEDREDSPSVIVVSHRLWRALGASPQIIGLRLTLNGSPATVVGVMPPGFAFPSREADAWVPLSISARDRANREGRWLTVVGRLASHATPADAAAEFDLICRRLASAYPATNAGWSVSLVPLLDEVVGKTRPVLLTLQACGLLLLLIACANLANLLLARGAARHREISVRAALGAGRARILRQLMMESFVLAALAGTLGMVLAFEGAVLVRRFGDTLIPRAADIRLNLPAALFALAATALTVLIAGLAPAVHTSLVDLRAHIGSGFRGPSRDVERRRGALIAIEVGLSAVLLVGSGLLGRSLLRLLSTDPGVRTDRVLTMRLTLPRANYPTSTAQNSFFQQILDGTRSLPGIVAAAEISDTPLQANNPTFEFVVQGRDGAPSAATVRAGLRFISNGYLRAAGIPLLAGRDFNAGDRPSTQPVALVNETMVRRGWPAAYPLGKTFRLEEDRRWITVAGVVPDIKHMGLEADEGPVVYLPYSQKTQDWMAWTTLLVRTAGEPLDSVPAIRSTIRSIDRNQPLAEIDTLDDSLARSTALPRFTTWVTGSVSGFSLLIALMGVYGLLAFTIARMMPELGIRLALGATPRQIGWLLLGRAMSRVLLGIGLGLLIAWWLSRWLESLLFGVRPHDPVTFAAVAGFLILTSLTAISIPAWRAARTDPTTALRIDG